MATPNYGYEKRQKELAKKKKKEEKLKAKSEKKGSNDTSYAPSEPMPADPGSMGNSTPAATE